MLLSIIVNFYNLSSGNTPEEIKKFALETFDLNLPGFRYAITHAKTPGDWFEIEAALYVEHSLFDSVIGFRLEIEFLQQSITIPSDNNRTEKLASTEFDIVTATYAIECKSSCHNKSSYKKATQQIYKEITMLNWFKRISKDLAEKKVTIAHKFEKAKRHFKKPKSVFTLNGPCTLGKDIQLYCSWIDQETAEGCIEQLKSIITFMARKTLLVLFKSYIPTALTIKFKENNIAYHADIEYEEPYEDEDKDNIDDLLELFNQAMQLTVYT